MDKPQVLFMMSGKMPTAEGDGFRCHDHTMGRVYADRIAQIEINGRVVETGTHMMLHASEGDLVRVAYIPPPTLNLTESDIAKARKTTTVNVVSQESHEEGPFNFGAAYEDATLSKVIDSLAAIRSSIPAEYRDSARCEINSESGYEGSHYASIAVSYVRPETDAEVVHRLEQEAVAEDVKRRDEYAQFERLAAKFNR